MDAFEAAGRLVGKGRFQALAQSGLVVLDGQHVIAAAFHNESGCLRLAMHGIGRHHTALQIQPLEHFLHGRNLIAALSHLQVP